MNQMDSTPLPRADVDRTPFYSIYDSITYETSPERPWPWGFYIYRTSYSDQDLWERYLQNLIAKTHKELASELRQYELDDTPQADVISSSFVLTPVEDCDLLEGASIETVQ
ncbi:hypothetical protein S7711_11116 [Stachybotrys chartarum IBT 7711]|uniref:Uncharacterized protein n=1 Tax=Stachybotrys chartarum (strain CBS 109288 / IBT 7711) TaxID=1280523 RepID=A0A084B330_STACB|nr:hypothetical protein S7711_11116 [Stachybotrys chartarum IBT 7711]